MNLRIALVTAREALPLDEDMPPLQAALAEGGVTAEVPCWDDPGVDWSRYDAALLRSTWDYVDASTSLSPGVIAARGRRGC